MPAPTRRERTDRMTDDTLLSASGLTLRFGAIAGAAST